MKRRRLFTIFAALSLVLFVAVVAVWFRSHYVPDTFSRTTASPQADGSLRTRSTLVTFADGECRAITWLADYSPGLIQRYRTPPGPVPLRWRSDPHYRDLWRDYVGVAGVVPKWEGLGFAYLVHPGDSTGSIPGTVPPRDRADDRHLRKRAPVADRGGDDAVAGLMGGTTVETIPTHAHGTLPSLRLRPPVSRRCLGRRSFVRAGRFRHLNCW